MIKNVVTLGLCAALVGVVFAGNDVQNNVDGKRFKNVMPNDKAIQKEMEKVELERKEIFSNPELNKFSNNFPNIQIGEVKNIDIEEIAKRYAQKADARKSDDLMVFVSFSMPKESLKKLIASTNRVGGVIVLRGFVNNSYKDTALALHALGESSGNVVVNPNAFVKYKVTSVPAVVLAKPDSIDMVDDEGCALPNTYAAIAGDVSLDYAIRELSTRAKDFESLAGRYLRQLTGGR